MKNQERVLKELELALNKVDDATIYRWAFDEEPAGARISKETGLDDVTTVPETTLKALVAYEWERRRRQEEQERARRERLIWALGQVVTILIAVGGWVVALLKSAGSP